MSKFKIDFSLTKSSLIETIQRFFEEGEIPEENLTTIEEFERRQIKLRRLGERYDKFMDIREKAEGIAYPMAVFAKELGNGTAR